MNKPHLAVKKVSLIEFYKSEFFTYEYEKSLYDKVLFKPEVTIGCKLYLMYKNMIEHLIGKEYVEETKVTVLISFLTNERILSCAEMYEYMTFTKEILNAFIKYSAEFIIKRYSFSFTPYEYELGTYYLFELSKNKYGIRIHSGMVCIDFYGISETKIENGTIKDYKLKNINKIVFNLTDSREFIGHVKIPDKLRIEGREEINIKMRFKELFKFKTITDLVEFIVERIR